MIAEFKTIINEIKHQDKLYKQSTLTNTFDRYTESEFEQEFFNNFHLYNYICKTK